jgi:hypothetical protein
MNKDSTPEEIEADFDKLGVPKDGVKFDRLAEAMSGARDVPGWEPPRVLPSNWREVERGLDGAKYISDAASLACVLSCSIESDGRPWLHMSVSHRKRIPTWGELRVTKELFLQDREAIQILPPKAKYINIHPNVLHLFALLDEKASTGLPDFTGGTGSI